ncbi:DUF2142 domain-containing protein [Actinospica durhamensis]|uniref:DUF2142 domain-containing protein n=1 Tax=Actinospica durhamensis TaxID=1508375 RepID=A0A941EUU6_9ACTN|nr:DUF2142 domain-containing protein [Actinospica durhamensis]MBR7836868.1 DUF2142 domain-containing protein [Actinospica durhamensis]
MLTPLLAFLAFLAMALSWSLGTPLLSGADEPEQSVKAAAVVRGEFSGVAHVQKQSNWESTYSTPDYLEIAYKLPHSLVVALAKHDPTCYAFQVEVTARCTGKANRVTAEQVGGKASSHMDYSPLYYLLVGWPSLILRGDHALYGMRVISALITAVLLALAFTTALRRRGAVALGTVAAATPAAIYFGAVVNPSGLEICSALLVWTTFLAMVRGEPGTRAYRRDGWLFTGASALLMLTRPLGPLWWVMIVALILATRPGPVGWLRRALSGRGFRASAGVLVVAGVLAGMWDATQNTMGIIPRANPHYTFEIGAYLTFQQTPTYVLQMLGLVGWNDVHVPEATVLLWYGVLTALLLVALALGDLRERLALLATTALVFVFPIAFEAYAGADYGAGWQGRYMLPIAVGVPILAAEILVRRLGGLLPGPILRALVTTLGGTVALAYLIEVWWAWRRYAQGLGPKAFTLPQHAPWSPRIGWPSALLLALAGCLGLFALLYAHASADLRRPVEGVAADVVNSANSVNAGEGSDEEQVTGAQADLAATPTFIVP